MKRTLTMTGKELSNFINEQADKIIAKAIQNKRSKTDRIVENVINGLKRNKRSKLYEAVGDGLWCEIRFVQGGDDDYEQIEQMFCGDDDAYCEANAQPVIDYLKQWDQGDCELTTNQPRIARNDTSYADESGDDYVLLYNSSVGGCFLLYRPATEQEVDWYYNNGDGSIRESKKHNLTEGLRKYKGFKCINVSPDPSFPNYEIVSPEGHSIATTLFPSEMKEIVDKYLKFGSIKESIDYDDHWAISSELEKLGWAYTDSYDVYNRKIGKHGVRYIIKPYKNNLDGIEPCDIEELKTKMTQLFGVGNVIFSEGQHMHAPEIKNLSMVVIENDEV